MATVIASSFVSKLLPIIQKHHTSNVPFPEYFAALKKLDVKEYTVTFQPYTCVFKTLEGETYTDLHPPYDVKLSIGNSWQGHEELPKVLANIRTNVINYPDFLNEAAKTGVHHYFIDFVEYKAKYFSENEDHVFIEPFPEFFKEL